MSSPWDSYAEGSASAIRSILSDSRLLDSVTEVLAIALKRGCKILFAGNGGSAGDSQHLAAEFVGRLRHDRKALPALSLTADSAVITALSNDYGFAQVFSRQVEALGNPGDVLIVLTTSGKSPNVLDALLCGSDQGLSTIALCGKVNDLISKHADFVLAVDSDSTSHIQEAHLAVGHALCAAVERAMGL